MLSEKPPAHRNKIDVRDAAQVRILKRRFQITEEELRRIVEKVGDSIATVCKEIEAEKARNAALGTRAGSPVKH